MRRALLLGVSFVAVLASAYPLPVGAAEPIKIEDDQFDQRAVFTGDQVDFHDPEYSEFSSTMRLRSWVEKATGKITHQLYVSNYYDLAWRYYAAATDETARSLEFVTIDRAVVSCYGRTCLFHETYGATLDDSVLRAAAKSGADIRVKFRAKDGPDQVLTVSSEIIQQQLAAVDVYRAKLPAPSPAKTTKRK